ncbi:MAG: hypothetical protein M3548_15065 [Actinomycetota bacterium]|nr:hypothetical protein [Actinomycetota bacterium]
MADSNQPEQPDRNAGPPVPYVPPDIVPGTSTPGGQFDAEQRRQFEEFQRFQEFQQTHGDAPSPHRRRPTWRRILFAKWFRRLAFLLVLAIAAIWAYQHYFGGPDDSLPASQTGGGKTERTVLFASTPKEAVRMIYDNIAQNTLPDACTRFETEAVEQQFANHFNAGDCASAVRRLHEEVGTANDYAEPYFPPEMDLTERTDGTVVISSCALEVRDGPRLGRFTVRKIPNARGEQWTIAKHEAEPVPCPANSIQPTA